MKRRLSTIAITLSVAALAFSGLTAPAHATTAAPALATADKVLSVPYSDDLYQVKNYGTASATYSKLSFSQWQALGAPTPEKFPADYVKYAWQDDVYAVSFFGPNRENWLWRHITLAEWNRAGNPAARNAGWILGSTFFKQASNNQEIFVQLGQKIHKLTFNEYVAAGSPTPKQYGSSIARLTWQENIGIFNNGLAGGGTVIDFAFWNFLAQPTPQRVAKFPGDTFTKACGSNDIMYKGPTFSGKLNLAQWQAAGSPAPTTPSDCAAPAPAPAPAPAQGIIPCSQVKANVNVSTKTKIYHVKGQRFYETTTIDTREGDRCFATTEEARAAGFRASQV